VPHPHSGRTDARGHPASRRGPHPTGPSGRGAAGRGPPGVTLDFDRAPFLVIWETTQACDLACKHCRAEAQPDRHPDELSTAEAKDLLRQIRDFGPIVFVFSGGDALKRPDIVELTRYGADLGLRMAITPATTPLCTEERIRELHGAGMARLAVSLDGPNAAIHDEFRQVGGSFDHGLRILAQARAVGLSTQVNTVVAAHNVQHLEEMAALLAEAGIVFWEVFFLVPMGRARPEDVVGAEAFERVFHQLDEIAEQVPYDIKATAAPQYKRVQIERRLAAKRRGRAKGPGHDGSQADGIGRARSVNDGDGFAFVSHTGDVYPSGFLPVRAGNIREDRLVDVYREAPLFKALRDKTRLGGKCGVCEYVQICGGSRARAWAVTGDPLAEEPFCAHTPRVLETTGRNER
jgi:radical SAM protein